MLLGELNDRYPSGHHLESRQNIVLEIGKYAFSLKPAFRSEDRCDERHRVVADHESSAAMHDRLRAPILVHAVHLVRLAGAAQIG